MSKYEQIEGLAEFVVELRDAGVRWDAADGIVERVQARFPAYTTRSAIPLRKLYHAVKADPTRATTTRVRNWRKAGWGWDRIAVTTGRPVAELKKLVEGTEWEKGRVYVSADGSTNIVDLAGKEVAAD